LLHVGRCQVGPEGRRILPFFDHRNHVWSGGWLAIDHILPIYRGSVFDAPRLGKDLWDKGVKQPHDIVAPPWGGAN
jgi:hypothetical protein